MERLFDQPRTFDFFQAVRLVELAASAGTQLGPVGTSTPPERESLRFRTRPSLAFAASDVERLSRDDSGAVEMQINFLGLVGTAGVLPQHYTRTVLDRVHLKDTTLRDFLDVFQHRSISLFYRAWVKYHFPIAFESEVSRGGQADRFTLALQSLVGRGLASARGADSVADTRYLFDAGHFARRIRTVAGLAGMLQDLFGVTARINEFVGRWLTIPEQERCTLLRAREHGSQRMQLGCGATLGMRAWEVRSKITIHLGPLTWAQFEQLRPGAARHASLCEAVRLYVGLELAFDLSFSLANDTQRGIQLVSEEGHATRLGRNSWLACQTQTEAPLEARFPGGQTPCDV